MMLASTNETRLCALPPGARVSDVADACRSAALGFAWGAPAWGRRELARWLAGPYATAIDPTRASSTPAPSARVSGVRPPIEEVTISQLVVAAHAGLLDTLRDAWTSCHEGSLSCTMIDLGIVTAVMDEEFAIGYAPVDFSRLRLVDRVTSLFVADFLTRPQDYDAFCVCARCASVTYDWFGHDAECESGDTPAPHVRLERRVPLDTLIPPDVDVPAAKAG
jgi:hypothetical protein